MVRKVEVSVNGKKIHYRTVWMKNNSVFMIEQNKLPFEFETVELKNYKETANAIKVMTVRGAGAIGVTAGFGLCQAIIEAKQKTPNEKEFLEFVEKARKEIEETRPTAVNLFYATKRVFEKAIKSSNPVEIALSESQRIADEDSEAGRMIGLNGEPLIKNKANVETHCNAGWLAFADWGTAISPIYTAKRKNKKVFVFVDETRPRSQGARLTAWELKNEGIEHAIIPDNAAAHYMSQGRIDLMIVGADRIAANGDTANKIGTMEKAICAKEFGIPFYIAAPLSTIDLNCESGKKIPIEERNEKEVLYQKGPNSQGKIEEILVANPGSKALNPSFDVTPAKYITGIITEKGIVKSNEKEIRKLFKQ